jgi:hypothetical protein
MKGSPPPLLRKMGYVHSCGRWLIHIAAEDGLYFLLRNMLILIAAENELHLFLIITNLIVGILSLTRQTLCTRTAGNRVSMPLTGAMLKHARRCLG